MQVRGALRHTQGVPLWEQWAGNGSTSRLWLDMAFIHTLSLEACEVTEHFPLAALPQVQTTSPSPRLPSSCVLSPPLLHLSHPLPRRSGVRVCLAGPCFFTGVEHWCRPSCWWSKRSSYGVISSVPDSSFLVAFQGSCSDDQGCHHHPKVLVCSSSDFPRYPSTTFLLSFSVCDQNQLCPWAFAHAISSNYCYQDPFDPSSLN